jgi:hypothetical protein
VLRRDLLLSAVTAVTDNDRLRDCDGLNLGGEVGGLTLGVRGGIVVE